MHRVLLDLMNSSKLVNYIKLSMEEIQSQEESPNNFPAKKIAFHIVP